MPAIPGCDSTNASPRFTPNTLAAVAKLSVSVARCATTETCNGSVSPRPVRGSTMWE